MLISPSLLCVLAGYAAALDGRLVHDHQWAQLRYLMTKVRVQSFEGQISQWLILKRRQ